MKKIISISVVFFTITSFFAFTKIAEWNISKGYNIGFSSGDASGDFEKFKGSIAFDPKDIKSSKFDVTVDVASINTGNWLKDKHAKNDGWFDAKKYPVISFTSSKVSKTASAYMAEGTLTIRAIKKNIKIPFTFTPNGKNGVFESSFTVNRMDFKIGKAGSVEDLIKIKIKVPVNK